MSTKAVSADPICDGYEMVIGLEVHAELKTASKIFCACPTAFGAPPNTQVCPVCLGMPGVLPVLNEAVPRLAVLAGLATGCAIAPLSRQDRKNYFYPDLPKAYQISQYDLPLCVAGHLDIETPDGTKRIGITRIHIEEDAGKLLHAPEGTRIDCNRCGVPLIEIVSEPDLRGAAEARAYLQKLRAILLYTGVSDCRMNEGSLRCDVNLSVRKKGDTALGTRTEIKNLNSFQFVVKAIEQEFVRQVQVLTSGGRVTQETRRFDEATGKTHAMRGKEDASDYRYFPDPDLPPIELSRETVEAWREALPVLPDRRKAEFMARFGLRGDTAEQLAADRALADAFEAAAAQTAHPKLLANLLLAETPRRLPPEGGTVPVAAAHLAALADLLGEGRVNSPTAREMLSLLWDRDRDPRALAEEMGFYQLSGADALRPVAEKILAENPKAVADYRKGKTAALQALVGRCMQATGGKGDPEGIRAVLLELLGE